MSNADLILGVVPAAIQLALTAIFIRRKLYARFLFFFAYTVYSIVATIVRLFVIGRPLLFYDLYWITEVVYGILALLAMREVFKIASDIFYFGRGMSRLIPPVAVLIVIGYAMWQALYHAPGNTFMAHLQSGTYSLMFGIRCLEVGICFLCLRLSWREHFPVTWRRYDFTILVGFGVYGSITLLVYLLWLAFPATLVDLFRYAPSGAYIVTTVIWLHGFLDNEPPVNKVLPTVNEVRQLIKVLDQGVHPHEDDFPGV
jgi:hypothetical protein